MHLYGFHTQEKPLSSVPLIVSVLIAVMLACQIVFHYFLPAKQVFAESLSEPPALEFLHLYSLGDAVASSKFEMLSLQAFDNQSGISLSFRDLDYHALTAWLGSILTLDPQSQYPLLSASRVYGNVADTERQRIIIQFVAEEFRKDPEQRWPWLAHAIYLAKHKLKDLPLALELAQTLRQYAKQAPPWARQMEIFLMDDMGETEAVKVLIGGLLESGRITDENELRFLLYRLQLIEEREADVSNSSVR